MEKWQPHIAIILVNYNGLKDTLECIESLNRVDYENKTIIVVDNGSTDNSLMILNDMDMEHLVIIDAGGNLGFSGGNNLGITYAINKGVEYILLLNNDTLVDINFLDALLATERQYHYSVIVTGKILFESDRKVLWYAGGTFNEITSRTTHLGIHKKDEGQFDEQIEVNFASGCCMLIPVTIIKNIGLMNEEFFLYCEDTDFCCKFIKGGYKIIYEPSAVIYHKVSSSSSKLNQKMNYYIVRNKLLIIKLHILRKYKFISYCYVFLESIKRVLTKEYSIDAVVRAYGDYLRGRYGKN